MLSPVPEAYWWQQAKGPASHWQKGAFLAGCYDPGALGVFPFADWGVKHYRRFLYLGQLATQLLLGQVVGPVSWVL